MTRAKWLALGLSGLIAAGAVTAYFTQDLRRAGQLSAALISGERERIDAALVELYAEDAGGTDRRVVALLIGELAEAPARRDPLVAALIAAGREDVVPRPARRAYALARLDDTETSDAVRGREAMVLLATADGPPDDALLARCLPALPDRPESLLALGESGVDPLPRLVSYAGDAAPALATRALQIASWADGASADPLLRLLDQRPQLAAGPLLVAAGRLRPPRDLELLRALCGRLALPAAGSAAGAEAAADLLVRARRDRVELPADALAEGLSAAAPAVRRKLLAVLPATQLPATSWQTFAADPDPTTAALAWSALPELDAGAITPALAARLDALLADPQQKRTADLLLAARQLVASGRGEALQRLGKPLVERLREDIHHADALLALLASLLRASEAAPDWLPLLAGLVSDKRVAAARRQRALEALAGRQLPRREDLEAIVSAALEPGELRAAALRTLSRRGAVELARYRELLASDVQPLATAAAEGLARRAPVAELLSLLEQRPKLASPLLTALVQREHPKASELVSAALAAPDLERRRAGVLAASLSEDPSLVAPLLALYKAESTSGATRRAAGLALVRLARDADLPDLIAALRASSQPLPERLALAGQLVARGALAIAPWLIHLLEHDQPAARAQAHALLLQLAKPTRFAYRPDAAPSKRRVEARRWAAWYESKQP